MTKEELQVIESLLKNNLKPIHEELKEVKKHLTNVETTMEEEFAGVKERLTKVEITIENETNRSINILSEGHMVLNRKLDENIALENRVEMLEHKVSAIQYKIKEAK